MNVLLSALLAAGLASSALATTPDPSSPALTGEAEVIWDEWGVPHIAADSMYEAAYGAGWAQMSANSQRVAVGYLLARGEAAACMGPDMLDFDRRMHTFGVPGRAAQWFQSQDREPRLMLEGFAAGMNAWIAANPPAGGPLGCLGDVRASDPLGYLQLALHVAVVAFGADQIVEGWTDPRGSNAFAVAPERTVDGRALLFINPHSPWEGPFVSFEQHLTTPDLDIYGMTFPGLPVPIMGFTGDHGWAHTFNDIDSYDLYELELDGEGYRYDGSTHPFQTRQVEIAVRGGDGALATETLDIRESVHGPVLAQQDGRALAVRLAGLDRPHLMRQYLAMARADSLEAFRAALAQQQMPITNTVYANQAGDTFYVFNGLAPARSSGTRAFWAGVVDGSDRELLWTDYLPFEAMPQFENPSSGFVQNSNDGPTTSTWPPVLDMAEWNPTLSDDSRTPRGDRSLRQLLQSEPMSLARMDDLRRSSVMDHAERARPLLAALALASDQEALQQMGQTLDAWDGSTRIEARGAVLFTEWSYRMRRSGLDMFAEASDVLDIRQTLKNPEQALAHLVSSGAVIAERYGRHDPAWGDVYRIRHAGLDLPSGIGRDELGAYRAGHYSFDRSDARFSLNSAAHFIAMVAFGEDGPEARGLMAYGNSERSDAPGVQRQLEMFSAGEVRTMHFNRADVLDAAVLTEPLVFGD
jgi:acyl-homoserine-lactone acylase